MQNKISDVKSISVQEMWVLSFTSGFNGVSVSTKSYFNLPFTSTSCAITPQPRSSNHSPSNKTSSSHEGWVKGKYASTHLISTPSPHRFSTIPTRVCFRLYSTNFTASKVCMACFSGVWFLSLPKISSGSFKMDKNTSQSLICIKHKQNRYRKINEVRFAWVTDPIATCDSMATDDTGNNNQTAWAIFIFFKEAKF